MERFVTNGCFSIVVFPDPHPYRPTMKPIIKQDSENTFNQHSTFLLSTCLRATKLLLWLGVGLFFPHFIFCDDSVPEIRRGRQCGINIQVQPETEGQKQAGEAKGQGQDLSPEEKKAIQNFPKKIRVERPRLIAKLKYVKNWTEDINAIKKLILFFEKTGSMSAFKVTAKDDGRALDLSREQKLSLFDQLRDFEITLDERPGELLDRPIFGGDVPSPLGGEEPIATFETISEHEQQNADAFVALFMSGHDDFTLDNAHLKTLRSYLLRGGFLIADSCCGETGFEQGFRKMLEQMFPGKKLELLSPEHPVYSMVYDLKNLRYSGREKPEGGKPRLLGMQLGCRTAILYSSDDISCAWDGHLHGEGVSREIHHEDALKLGTNMLTYALGYRTLSSPLTAELPEDTKPWDAREVVFAQLAFQGDCDPHPYGSANLIKRFRETLNLPIKPTRVMLKLSDNDLNRYPLVYLTGHGTIGFSESEVGKLEGYLSQGGFLLVDPCCGDEIFEHSFHELMKKVLKKFSFKILNPEHPIFKSYFPTRSIPLRQKGRAVLPKKWAFWNGEKTANPTEPFFLGWFLENRLCVFYSPLDIGCSLEGQPCLLCEGIDPKEDSGFKLMTNILLYLLNP